MDDVFKGLGIGEGQTSDPTNPMNIAFKKEMEKLRDEIKDNLKSKGSVAPSALLESVHITPPITENGVTKSSLIMVDYAKYRDKGVSGHGQNMGDDSKPMKETASPFKFKDNGLGIPVMGGSGATGGVGLMAWAQKVGLPREAAWGLSHSIKQRGIKGNKFYSEITTPERWRQFAQSIEKALADGNNSN